VDNGAEQLSTDFSPLLAIFQDLRFGIKLILSSKRNIIDVGVQLNSSHD
jgi:hypothetical protein